MAFYSLYNLAEHHMKHNTWFQAGGPSYAVELGRLDGRVSTKASVRHHLPHPEFKLEQLNQMFASHGLTLTDLVALSGISFILNTIQV